MADRAGSHTGTPGTETLASRWITSLKGDDVHDLILIMFNPWRGELFLRKMIFSCIFHHYLFGTSHRVDAERSINSLPPRRCHSKIWQYDFQTYSVIQNSCWHLLWNGSRGMPLNLVNEKSTLVQVMDLCWQATSHYFSPLWPKSLSSYGTTLVEFAPRPIIPIVHNTICALYLCSMTYLSSKMT